MEHSPIVSSKGAPTATVTVSSICKTVVGAATSFHQEQVRLPHIIHIFALRFSLVSSQANPAAIPFPAREILIATIAFKPESRTPAYSKRPPVLRLKVGFMAEQSPNTTPSREGYLGLESTNCKAHVFLALMSSERHILLPSSDPTQWRRACHSAMESTQPRATPAALRCRIRDRRNSQSLRSFLILWC